VAGVILLGQLTIGRRLAIRRLAAVAEGPADISVTETSVTFRRPDVSVEVTWAAVRVVETACKVRTAVSAG
jgi:hypothetical protein